MADTNSRWTAARLLMYDIKTGTADTLVRGPAFGACFSPDGRKVAYVGPTGGRIKIIDVISKHVDSIGNPLAWKFTLSWANDNCIYYSREYGKALLKINVETEQVDTVYRMQMTYNNLTKITDVASFYTGNVCANGTRGAYTVMSDQIGNRGVSFDFASNFELMINNADGDARLSCQATMSPDGQWVAVANYNHSSGVIRPYNSNSGPAYRMIPCPGIWMIHFAYNSNDELVYKNSTDEGTYYSNLVTGESRMVMKKGCAWAYDARGWVADTVSPAAPTALQAAVSELAVTLSWTVPASGARLPSAYIVERNGVRIGRTEAASFTDKNVVEDTEYTYTVYGCTDGVGVSAPLTGTFRTPVDHNPPSLVVAYSFGAAVDLVFSEPVDSVSSSGLSHYSMDPSVTISAAIRTSPRRVRLTIGGALSTLADSIVRVSGVKDLTPLQNTTVSTSAVVTIVKDLWSSTGRLPHWAFLDSGALVWYDDTYPEYRFASRSLFYDGLPYFQTSWRDGTADSTQDYIRFNISRKMEVFIVGNPPAWVKNAAEWTNTGTFLNGPVYSKVFNPGVVNIKGSGLGNYNTFVVVLRDAEGLGTRIDEAQASAAMGPALRFSPSPSQSRTKVAYHLVGAGHVRLSIYDSRGRLIRTLADKVLPGGAHRDGWNGRDSNNRMVPSGLYFFRLSVNGLEMVTRKLIVIQ
jgi:hypothetical protein